MYIEVEVGGKARVLGWQVKPHPYPCWNTWPPPSATFLESRAKKMLERVGGLGLWDLLVGVESEGATLQHKGSKVAHDRLSLEVKVAEHFIGPPTSQKPNKVRVHMGAEEGHGPCGPETAGRDVRRQKTQGRGVEGHDSYTKSISDVLRSDGPPGGAVKVNSKGGAREGTKPPEVNDTACEGQDRAQLRIAGAGLPNNFTPHTILLGGESETPKGGREELCISGCGKVQAVQANKQLGILHQERSGFRGSSCVLAGAK